MLLKKLRIQNYKKFERKEINLSKGINLIFGKNESGKTTFTNALMDVLFKDPSTNSKVLRESFRSWKTDKYPRLELYFMYEKEDYSLIKDFQAKTLELKNLDTNVTITDYKTSLTKIKEMIGISDEKIYEITGLVSQGDMIKVALGNNLLHEITGMTTTDENSVAVKEVTKKLKNDLVELTKGMDRPSSNPGEMKKAIEDIARLKKLLEEKKSIWDKKKIASEINEETEIELKKVEEKIEYINELLINHQIGEEAYAQIEEISKELKELEELISSMEKLETEENAIKEKISQLKNFEEIEDYSNQLLKNEEVLKLMREQLNELNQNTEISSSLQLPKVKSSKTYYILILVFGVVTALLGIFFWIFKYPNLYALIVFVVGLIVELGLVISFKNSKSKSANQENTRQIIAIREDNESKIKLAEENIRKILAKYQSENTNDFFAKKAEYLLLKSNLSDISSRKRGLSEKYSLKQLKDRQTDLFIRKKEIEKTSLSEVVVRSMMSNQEYLEQTRELKKLEKIQTELKKEAIESSVRMLDSNVEYADVVLIEEELAMREDYLRELNKKEKVIKLAIDNLQEAILQVAKSANQVLKEFVETRLPLITENRYKKIKVESDLTLKVYSEEKADWVDPIPNLSKGTVDQIYLLTRIGFARLLSQEKGMPLIFDDPFVTADQDRLEGIKEILEDVGEINQIIILTNDITYFEWGNVIEI